MSRRRLLLILIIVALMYVAGWALFGVFAWWTHKLIYVDHNDEALALIAFIIIGGGFVADIVDDGEITFSKTRRWRPEWAKRFRPIAPADPPTVELQPGEYETKHRQ